MTGKPLTLLGAMVFAAVGIAAQSKSPASIGQSSSALQTVGSVSLQSGETFDHARRSPHRGAGATSTALIRDTASQASSPLIVTLAGGGPLGEVPPLTVDLGDWPDGLALDNLGNLLILSQEPGRVF